MDRKTLLQRVGDQPILAIGIDVSKAELVVGLITAGKPRMLILDNEAPAVAALADALAKRVYTGMLILESTGYYHWCAALGLSQAGLDVRLVNPLMASKHARSCIRKTKTDAVDAIGLGHMALTERKLPPRFDKGPDYVRLRHRMGLIQKFDKTLQGVNAALADYRSACRCAGQPESSPRLDALNATVRNLQADKQALLDEFTTELKQRSAGSTLYQSVPGISKEAAAVMSLMLDPRVARPKAWIAYTGLDLSVRQSGTWTGPSRLTKRGDAYLRKRLFQAAWGAVMNDPDFKAYYDRLRAESRPYKEAIIIVARKLLRICFTLAKSQKTYDRQLAWG